MPVFQIFLHQIYAFIVFSLSLGILNTNESWKLKQRR